jgi:aminopeptidase N
MYLLAHFNEFGDPLTRGAIWATLWEEMLDGRVLPQELMDLALEALAVEDTEQVAQLILDGVRQLFWRYSGTDDREQVAPMLERTLRSALDRIESPGTKAAYFSTFRSVATTGEGVGFLERVWSREASIPGLTLSEADETAIAEELALRSHPRWSAILEEQIARVENADRRDRLRFIKPSLSPDVVERAAFVVGLRDPANRQREPWVVDGLAYLNHPLRAAESRTHLRGALAMLTEIRETGDIFFPVNWTSALLGGHNSPEAAGIVRGFLDEQGSDYPRRLRRIVLQAADPLFRSVDILNAAEN